MGQHQLEVLGNRDRLSLTPWSTQELVKHTQDTTEKENLRLALDAMRVREQVLLVGYPCWQRPLCLNWGLTLYPWLWKGLGQGIGKKASHRFLLTGPGAVCE